jgi:hypothetical protein
VKPVGTPEMRAKYNALRGHLSPAASSWVQTEAIVAAKNHPLDVAAVEAAVRGRFGSQLPSGGDISEMCFIVLMNATDDQDNDLQIIMNQVQATTQQKNRLREMQAQLATAQNELNQQLSADHSRAGKTNAASATVKCTSPACTQLAQKASEANQLAAASGTPSRFTVPSTPTAAQLADLQKQTSTGMDSLGDLSQEQQLKMQMMMDQRSKLEETLSNIMKKMSDTSESIVQNLK